MRKIAFWLNNLSPMVAPLLSMSLLVLSSAPFMSFTSILLETDSASKMLIGFVHSFFYAGFLLGSLYADRFAKKVGYIRTFAAFASLYSVMVLFQAIVHQHIFWMFFRFLGGFSVATLYVVIESWLVVQTPKEKRGKILAIYMIILYASQSISQLFVHLINISFILPYLIAALFASVSVLPVSLTKIQSPDAQGHSLNKLRFFEIYNKAPFGFWGCLISGCILSSIYSFVPNYAFSKNISVAFIMCFTIGGGFILQWPIGYLSDLFDRKKILLGISIAILFPSIFLFFSSSVAHIYIFSFILGGLCFTLYPISITQICNRVDNEYISYVLGILSLVYGFGCIIGPLLSSAFIASFSLSYLYLYITLVSFFFSLAGLSSILQKPKFIKRKEKNAFVSVPARTKTAVNLDPRIEKTEEDLKEEKTSLESALQNIEQMKIEKKQRDDSEKIMIDSPMTIEKSL